MVRVANERTPTFYAAGTFPTATLANSHQTHQTLTKVWPWSLEEEGRTVARLPWRGVVGCRRQWRGVEGLPIENERLELVGGWWSASQSKLEQTIIQPIKTRIKWSAAAAASGGRPAAAGGQLKLGNRQA